MTPGAEYIFYGTESNISLTNSMFLYGDVQLNHFVFTALEQMYHQHESSAQELGRGTPAY